MAKNTEKIEIKIEGKEWESALDFSFKKNVKNAKIDGFRKGAIPKEMYIKKFGIESLFMDAANHVIESAYKKAMDKRKVEPVIEPVIDIKEVNKDGITFTIDIIGKPEIKLGNYKKLGIKRDEVKVTKKEIDEEITRLRDQFAEIRVKDDGKVEDKDTAIIDFKGTVDGKELEGGTGENYPLEIGSHTFIPGFEEGLIGMSVGEEKDLDLVFPENYVKDLAGKKVKFHVTLREIKTRVLPEMDEDFFKDLGYENVTNEAELKTKVEEVLKSRKQFESDDKFIESILEKASANMEVEISEEIVSDEVHRMLDQFASQLKGQGLSVEQYMEFAKKTHEDMHKDMEPEAIKRIKYRYLIEEIANKEKIEVTDEEVEHDAEEMAKNYGITKDELLKAFGGMEVMKYDSRMRKTLDFLKNNN